MKKIKTETTYTMDSYEEIREHVMAGDRVFCEIMVSDEVIASFSVTKDEDEDEPYVNGPLDMPTRIEDYPVENYYLVKPGFGIYYQPEIDDGCLPKELFPWQIFETTEECRKWMKKHGYNNYSIMEYSNNEIEKLVWTRC